MTCQRYLYDGYLGFFAVVSRQNVGPHLDVLDDGVLEEDPAEQLHHIDGLADVFAPGPYQHGLGAVVEKGEACHHVVHDGLNSHDDEVVSSRIRHQFFLLDLDNLRKMRPQACAGCHMDGV